MACQRNAALHMCDGAVWYEPLGLECPRADPCEHDADYQRDGADGERGPPRVDSCVDHGKHCSTQQHDERWNQQYRAGDDEGDAAYRLINFFGHFRPRELGFLPQ